MKQIERSSLIVVSVAFSVGWFAADGAAAKPNLVLVMADDLGWSDTSNTHTNLGHPSDYYETPELERLAAEGMAFTNAYTNGPNCGPTRAAMLTGQYAQRPTNNIYLVGDLNRGGSDTLLVGPPQGLSSGTDAIPNNSFTFAEMLQDADYRTSHFGKFHVVESGTAAADIVAFHGFHENYGGNTSGAPGAYHASNATFSGNISPSLDAYAADYTQAYVDANIRPHANGTNPAAIDALVGTDKHVSDALADAAIDFMEREKAGPFLVQFQPYAVHTPIGNTQARADLLNKYQNKPAGSQDTNASFGALIEGMDQSVARLIDYLERTPDPNHPGQNLDENTLVIFFSDNGGRQSQSNNGPLKGQKGELDEGGIRVPMIAWSGNSELVDGGTINATPVAGIDFYETFAAFSGAGDPMGVTLDGEDLSGIFADVNADLGREALFWHLPGYLIGGGRDLRPASVIRSDQWKLRYNYEDQSFELYDLENDISELDNVAVANPEVVDRLGLRLMHWLNDTDAPLATLRADAVTLNITGSTYANETITDYSGTPVMIHAGEEVPFVLGDLLSIADLNSDTLVNVADWLLFRDGQGADLTGLSTAEAYMNGDVDGDLDNDVYDFVVFKQAFEHVHGAGSLSAVLAVPEPASLGLGLAMACAGMVLVSRKRVSRRLDRRIS